MTPTKCPECASSQVTEITDTRGDIPVYAERVFECEECAATFTGEDAARRETERQAADPWICKYCKDKDGNPRTFSRGQYATAHEHERHGAAHVTYRNSWRRAVAS